MAWDGHPDDDVGYLQRLSGYHGNDYVHYDSGAGDQFDYGFAVRGFGSTNQKLKGVRI